MTSVDDELIAYRQASFDLAEATRELMLAAATSDVEIASLRAAADEVRGTAELLRRRRRDRVLRSDFDGPARARAAGADVAWRPFPYQPVAFPMEIRYGEDDARASIVASALFEGPRDSLHGGYVAHIMDCMLGTLMQARETKALTASLEVTYLRPTPLDEPLEAYSRIVGIDGRKTVAEGWIEHEGVRTAQARGLFIAPRDAE